MRFTIVCAIAGAAVCVAQTPGAPQEMKQQRDFFYSAAAPIPQIVGDFGGGFSFDNHVVKGAPYTADTSTETTQTLADGNRIVRTETGAVARDSEGRTRREMSMSGVGPWASSGGEPAKMIFINDPVAQVNYVLTPEHTAHKMPTPSKVEYVNSNGGAVRIADAAGQAQARSLTLAVPVTDSANGQAGGPMVTTKGMAEMRALKASGSAKTESLGTQMMEGVQAEGKRMTTTIPAGEMGNERPLEIVNESWYSPDLQTTVMTRRSDPRNGETIYKLTNIQRVEPPQSMFVVPSDYKLEDGPDVVRSIRIQKPE